MTTTSTRVVAMGLALVVLVGIGLVGVVLSPLLAILAMVVGIPLLVAVAAVRRGSRKLDRILREELDDRDT